MGWPKHGDNKAQRNFKRQEAAAMQDYKTIEEHRELERQRQLEVERIRNERLYVMDNRKARRKQAAMARRENKSLVKRHQ